VTSHIVQKALGIGCFECGWAHLDGAVHEATLNLHLQTTSPEQQQQHQQQQQQQQCIISRCMILKMTSGSGCGHH
jgi:transcription initiation factor TFIID subunit TAF12